jgi:hypothetical protein
MHIEIPHLITEIANINPITKLICIVDGYNVTTAKTINIYKFETWTATEDINRAIRP